MAALLQLKLTLVDVKPPIWRRLVVTNQISLRRLHDSIQSIAGWEDKHLHEFVINERRYGQPAPHEVVPVENEALFRLHSLPLAKGTSFFYVYDFGDHWEIEVKVERVLPPGLGGPSLAVLDGARAFPPEDSGGVPGYEDLLEILSDPTNPEYEEYRLWVGEDFDPERFDLAATNERLPLLASKLV
jgi:Plasmid pRiA4b ORF-3-like protein